MGDAVVLEVTADMVGVTGMIADKVLGNGGRESVDRGMKELAGLDRVVVCWAGPIT